MTALCVSGAYPAGVGPATGRAGLVLLGGGLPMAVSSLIRWASGTPFSHTERLEPFDWNWQRTKLGSRFPLDDAGLLYTARVAAVLTVAALVQHLLRRWQNGYWVPMTATIVLKTDLATTATRGVARLAGTAAGAAGVTLLARWPHPLPAVLAAVIVAALWAAFAVRRVNYGLFAARVTAYVVCLLAVGKLPVPGVAERRAAATLIGGALALGSYLVLPPGRPPAPQTDRG